MIFADNVSDLSDSGQINSAEHITRDGLADVLGLGDVDSCPVALGSRWLAFGDRKVRFAVILALSRIVFRILFLLQHEPINQSLGGISSDAMTSYTGKIISVMDACTNVRFQ